MALFRTHPIAVLAGAAFTAFALPALAQSTTTAGPDYSSGLSVGGLAAGNFNTPESDGRPGVKYFAYGARAFRDHDYAHAIDMFKVSASWGYKPAEYNLGLMYYKGQGVPVNKPLGTAWMVLAAERGNKAFVRDRDLMVTSLTHAQFAETDKLWGALRKTYGDKVALRRAKSQWAWVKDHQIGSHAGMNTGEASIGIRNTGIPVTPGPASGEGSTGGDMVGSAAGMLQSGSVPGSVAYRQFSESANPYSPIFLQHNRGTASVGPLQQIRPAKVGAKPAAAKSAPASASSNGR